MSPDLRTLESPFLVDELCSSATVPGDGPAMAAVHAVSHSPFLPLGEFEADPQRWLEPADEHFDDEDDMIEAVAEVDGLPEPQEAFFASEDEGEAYVYEGAKTSTAAADEAEAGLDETLMDEGPDGEDSAVDVPTLPMQDESALSSASLTSPLA
jgi:hypothetical protein